MECIKIFTFESDKQRKQITWSCNQYDCELNDDDKTIKVVFPDSYDLYGWAQVFKKYFGYLPSEASA